MTVNFSIKCNSLISFNFYRNSLDFYLRFYWIYGTWIVGLVPVHRGDLMVVVNVNLGIGYASSGVEYAQAYRSRLLKSMGRKQKNVFLDFMPDDTVYDMASNLGIPSDSVVWLYDYFRDSLVSSSVKKLTDLEKEWGTIDESRSSEFRKYFGDENDFIIANLSRFNPSFVTSVEYVNSGCLVLKEYFSESTIYCRERFTPISGVATRYVREFYNTDGTLYLQEFLDDTKNSRFLYKGELYPTKEALFKLMMSKVLTNKDFVLLDRASGTAKALFSLKDYLKFKLGVVVHAEHFVPEGTKDGNILWNNFYDYVFRNSDKVNVFICSTELQSDILKKQIKHCYNKDIATYTTPVGYLEELKGKDLERDLAKLVTVSRLSSEKNLDILIESLATVKGKGYEFILDIYGEGSERIKLESLIKSKGLEDCIFLKGHVDVSDIYKDYSCYVSASQGEGFGLSLMEAVGSGLFLVGYDVNYGNPTFCKQDETGYLVPYVEGNREENVLSLADGVEKYLGTYLTLHRSSVYNLAEGYLKDKVKECWRSLLNDKSI